MITLGFRMMGRKARAFRADRCRACERDVVAVRQRRWIWLSLFIVIPLLPLGFRNVWVCQSCDETTTARPRTSLLAKLMWLGFAALIISFGFDAPADPTVMGDEPPRAVFFVSGGLLAAYCAIKIIKHRRIPTRAETLEGFEPSAFESCPLCGSPLEEEAAIAAWSLTRCSGCGLADEALAVDGHMKRDPADT